MNKTGKIIVLIFVAALLGGLGYMFVHKMNQKTEAAENIKTLPSFSFKTLDGAEFSNKDLKAQTPTVFLFFSTQCDFCHYEAREIKKNIEQFSNYQICMVCSDKLEEIAEFTKVYDLDKYPQIKVLQDPERKSFTYFAIATVPSTYIYSGDGSLIKEYKGETKIEAVLDAIRK